MSYYPVEDIPNPSFPSENPSNIQYVNTDIVLTSEPIEGDSTSTSVTLDQGFIEFRHTDNLNTSYVLTLSDRGLVTSQFGYNTRYSQGEIVASTGIGIYSPAIAFGNGPTETIVSFVSPVALANKSIGTVGQVFTSAGANTTPYWSTPSGGGSSNLTANTLLLGTPTSGFPIPATIDSPAPDIGENVGTLNIGTQNTNGIFLGRANTLTQINGNFFDSTGTTGIPGSSLLLCGDDTQLVWNDTTYLKTEIAQQTYVPFSSIPNNLFTGLYNSLNLRPYSNYTQEDVVWSNLPVPSSWRSDITTAPPIAGGNQNGWKYQRTSTAGSAIQWSMYNPTYGQTTFPLQLDFPPIPKSSLQSAWFEVFTEIPLTQTSLYMTIYTYDFTNPPIAPNFYTTRTNYFLNPLNLPDTTIGTSTKAQFRYIFFCCDAIPMNPNPASPSTIQIANGQPSQRTMRLGDPFNLQTNYPHIKMNAVSYAFNTPYNSLTAPDLPIIGINIVSNAGTITNGVDFTIQSCGFSDGSSNQFLYNLTF